MLLFMYKHASTVNYRKQRELTVVNYSWIHFLRQLTVEKYFDFLYVFFNLTKCVKNNFSLKKNNEIKSVIMMLKKSEKEISKET